MPGDVVRLYDPAREPPNWTGRLLFVNLAFTDAERRRTERLAQHERERSEERA